MHMLVKQVYRHQYQYTGHYIIFIQNIIQTINMLPNLLSELNIILLRLLDSYIDNAQYYQQFQTDFCIRQQYILTWLCFLKANYPDYYYITISIDYVTALLVDSNVSVSVLCIIDNMLSLERPIKLANSAPNSQLVIIGLDQDTIEANLILKEITGQRLLPIGVPAPSIQYILINKASGREYILALAFLTLYPTSQADFNTPRLQNVPLKDYTRYLLCQRDQRFAQHARQRFFVFNIYIYQKARSIAQFYIL